MFGESDDYPSAELIAILDHRYAAGILEFKLEHSNWPWRNPCSN